MNEVLYVGQPASLMARHAPPEALRLTRQVPCARCRTAVLVTADAIDRVRKAATEAGRFVVVMCGGCAQELEGDAAVLFLPPGGEMRRLMRRQRAEVN